MIVSMAWIVYNYITLQLESKYVGRRTDCQLCEWGTSQSTSHSALNLVVTASPARRVSCWFAVFSQTYHQSFRLHTYMYVCITFLFFALIMSAVHYVL